MKANRAARISRPVALRASRRSVARRSSGDRSDDGGNAHARPARRPRSEKAMQTAGAPRRASGLTRRAALDVERGLDAATHECLNGVGHDGEQVANALALALAERTEYVVLERAARRSLRIAHA